MILSHYSRDILKRFVLLAALLVFATCSCEDASSRITIITTTSPERHHPATTCLEIAHVSLAKHFPHYESIPQIIVFDGLRDNKLKAQYEQFKRNMQRLVRYNPIFKNVKLVFCNEHKHITGAIEEALKHVNTKYVFVHQDDFVLQRSFNLDGLLDTMDKYEEVKFVRFNSWTNYDLSKTTPGKVEHGHNYGDQYFDKSKVPLLRNFRWSDNDHITTVQYYKDWVIKAVDGRKMPMEAAMMPYLKHFDPFEYGLYLYGKSCAPAMIEHIDRKSSVW